MKIHHGLSLAAAIFAIVTTFLVSKYLIIKMFDSEIVIWLVTILVSLLCGISLLFVLDWILANAST